MIYSHLCCVFCVLGILVFMTGVVGIMKYNSSSYKDWPAGWIAVQLAGYAVLAFGATSICYLIKINIWGL